MGIIQFVKNLLKRGQYAMTTESLASITDHPKIAVTSAEYRRINENLRYYQSNIEGELINKLQEVGFTYDGVVLNAGAYTHTSIALQDCIRSMKCPCVEVHISNVHKREEFRHHSYISCACLGVICGFGLASYDLAIAGILSQKENGE